jgi:hypothetical protein
MMVKRDKGICYGMSGNRPLASGVSRHWFKHLKPAILNKY